MKKKGCAPKLPEDLYHLIKKAVAMRKHLEKNKNDIDSKFRLNLKESRIHRITRYYRKTGKVEANFKYVSKTASTLVSGIWIINFNEQLSFFYKIKFFLIF